MINSVLPPSDIDLEILNFIEDEWGAIYSYPINSFHVGRLRLSVQIADPTNFETEGNFLHDNLPTWRNYFMQYVEIITKRSLRIKPQTLGLEGENIYMRIWTKAESDKKKYSDEPYEHPVNISIDMKGNPIMHLETVTWVLEKLKNISSPPIEYLLLAEASHDYYIKNFEKAVIQASTAIEIVLEKAIIDAINTPVEKDVIGIFGPQTLGKKYSIMKSLGFDLESFGYLLKFVKLRNAVAHKWEKPNREEVYSLIEAAENILDHFSPIEIFPEVNNLQH